MMAKNLFKGIASTLLVAGLLLLDSTAFAATITGVITNNTTKTGRVYVGLRDSNGNRQIGVSTIIAASPGTASYSITGVPEGQSYSLEAYLDTVGAGIQHANDPYYKSAVTLVLSGDLTDQNFPLIQPVPVTFTNADTTRNQFSAVIYPATDGTAAMIVVKEVPYVKISTDTELFLPIHDKIRIACSGAGVETAPVDIPVNENMMAFFKGLNALGETMTCTADPLINNVVDSGHQITFSETISPAGSTGAPDVKGNYKVSGVAPGASTPLHIVLEDMETGFMLPGAVPVPDASGSFTIPNVPTGSYRVYGLIDANSNHLMDAGDLTLLQRQIPRVVVDGLNASYHAGTMTLDKANKVDAAVMVSHIFTMSDPPDEFYNTQFSFKAGSCQVAHVSLNNTSTSLAIPLLPAPRTLIPDQTGGVEYWNSGSYTRPFVGDSYLATITYTDSAACPTDTNVILQVKTVPDALPRPSFPWGKVFFSGAQRASWQTPSPFPLFYYEPSGEGDPLPPTSLSTPLSNVTVGNSQWKLDLNDLLGNRNQVVVPYTPMGSGPVITGFSPLSGPAGTPVTINGSNLMPLGVVPLVTFNGKPAIVNASDDASISVIVPEGAGTGPVTVTAGGAFGYGVTTASIESFTPTISLGAYNSTGSLPFRVKIPGSTCGFSDTAGCVSGAVAHLPGTSLSGTTVADGTYTINNVPAGVPAEVMVKGAGYRDSFSAYDSHTSDVDFAEFDMIDDAMLETWNSAEPGSMTNVLNNTKGVIRSSVMRNHDEFIAGATVKAYSWRNGGAEYTVMYGDSTGTEPPNALLTETGTGTRGRFYVLDVDDGDFVTVVAEKNGYLFRDRVFHVRAGAVSQSGPNYGDLQPIVTLSANQSGPDYTDPVKVSLSASSPSIIHYTTNLSDPRYFGTPCSSIPTTDPCNLTLTEGSTQIYYSAQLPTPVNMFGEKYGRVFDVYPDTISPTTTASPPGGSFASSINVYLTVNEPATIYYTTNGDVPTFSSPFFTDSTGGIAKGPINLTSTATVKFFALDSAWNVEAIKQQTYTKQTATTITVATPAVINFTQSSTFTATVTPSGATGTVQFKVDGVNAGSPVTVSAGTATSAPIPPLSVGSHTVTAVFTGTGAYASSSSPGVMVGLVKVNNNGYSTMQAALNAAVNNDTIMATSTGDFVGAVTFNRAGVSLKLSGGYNSNYSTQTGVTRIDGSLKISNGTLRVKKLAIR